ncbi:MAG: glycerate kinase [Reyranellaceae bacterium]
MSETEPRLLLRALFDAAIAAASPAICLRPHLEKLPPPGGRTVVVGAGKAAAAMAKAVEDFWPHPVSGLVVTRYGHGAPLKQIELVEAAHPVPDAAGRDAAGRILKAVQGLDADDLVIALISGGGSALLALPAPGLTLDDKQAVNRALLRSGAPISAMNVVRKHLSAIKGGRLAAAAAPARLVAYAISDVPGDDLSIIASGPTVPDPSTYDEALAILARYDIDPPPAVSKHLQEGAAGRIAETPKPGDPVFARAATEIIATPLRSLEAAAELAHKAGYEIDILGDAIEGEARDVAAGHARLALAAKAKGRKLALISGGETTVTVRGQGRGGRNCEYLLGLALALDGAENIWAVAGDTDGIDGSEDNAGAIVTPHTLSRAKKRMLDPQALLENNDSWRLFQTLDYLIVTGPTRTNVNDFRAILVN